MAESKNDETLESSWVQHEITAANDHSIPIITIIDTDLQPARLVIDKYISGHACLFSRQVINYSTSYRENAYRLMAGAVNAAVADAAARPDLALTASHANLHGRAPDCRDLAMQLLYKIRGYGAVHKAWSAFDVKQKGFLSRSDFKRVIHNTVGLVCSDTDRKQLREKLDPEKTTRVSYEAFLQFVGDHQQNEIQKEIEKKEQKAGLPALPRSVPNLPDCFRPRPNVETQLKRKLLEHGVAKSRSCVTAQGMGGVGKSVLTASGLLLSDKFVCCVC